MSPHRQRQVSEEKAVEERKSTASALSDDPPLKAKSCFQNIRTMHTTKNPEIKCHRLLPPIDADCDASSSTGRHSPAPWKGAQSPQPQRLWSRYHSGCVASESNWPPITAKKSPLHSRERKQTKNQRKVLHTNFKDGDSGDIMEYLDSNRDLIEQYVMERVTAHDIEGWLAKKITKQAASQTNHTPAEERRLVKFKFQTKPCKQQVLHDLLKIFKNEISEHTIVWELARSIAVSVGVDAYRLFKLYPDHPNFIQYFFTDVSRFPFETPTPRHLVRAEPNEIQFVLEAARRGSTWRVTRDHREAGNTHTPNDLFKAFQVKNVRETNHVMYQPIATATGRTSYVIEMWRVRNPFTAADEELSGSQQVWGSLALQYCTLYADKARERNMTDFLLDVVKAIFEEMVSLDQLIKRILEFAQRLVYADRASLFLVDYRNFELVSTVFDLKFEAGQSADVEKKEIRMPINRGIAGHVALSGETMNIPDAYADYRFNRAVDEATGYKTVSILCMPIKVQGKVIGVVQMVNKRTEENFDHEDEVSFEMFSTFFGLALHHARLYDKIMRKEQKYRVALEVLSYHNTCRENEVQTILGDKEDLNIDLNDFYLDPYKFDEFQKCKAVITMFNDLFDISNFDIVTLTRFVLTVKKNYRDVHYHNFDHGWSVAQAMYVIVKNDKRKRFSYILRLALFVASLCHDLDHRGYTNKYMSETASPLAAMYTTSTLEHHHFNITVTILQQDGHNIFAHMSNEDYKEILGLIRQCILATDLAAFFPNLEKMKNLYDGETPSFNWDMDGHRDLAMAISMTAADLSASAKPWEVQIKTVNVIFKEFYEQGDKEKEAGKVPIAMMDRNKPEEQPGSQVGFLSQICIPCYNMLFRILPNTKPMYVMALKNLDKWKSRANRHLRQLEYQKNVESGVDIEDIVINNINLNDDNFELNVIEEHGEMSESKELEQLEGNDEESENEEESKIKDAKQLSEAVIDRHLVETRSDFRSRSVSWEEEEKSIVEVTGKEFWKDVKENAWMDDEEVVVKPKHGVDTPSLKKNIYCDEYTDEKKS